MYNLPIPLNKDEEKQIINGLDQAENRHILAERNLRLVFYLARKFQNTGIEEEEIFGVGTIGLLKAVNSFNPDKKVKFATYASRCIENEILMTIRKNKKHRLNVSLQEPITEDYEGHKMTIEDTLSDVDDYSWIDLDFLSHLLTTLSERELYIIKSRFLGEFNQRQISEKMGISQSYISRLEKHIIGKLRKESTKKMAGV